MAVLATLYKAEHQVSDVEGPTPCHYWGWVSLKDQGVDSKTDKRKCVYIKGKSDVAIRCSRH